MQEIELNDISNELLIINQITIERLFKEDNQNALVLYLFYYKTAKWQQCNPIKASDEYCKKCLHWGEDKLRTTKKNLKKMQLIEIIKKTDEKGLVIGWYVKVNYLVDKSRTPETTTPVIQEVDLPPNKILINNSINANNNINKKEDINKLISKKERFIKPTINEIKTYCLERNNDIDAEMFFDFYESKNWMIGKNKMKDWKACVRTWERSRKNKPKKETQMQMLNRMIREEREKNGKS